MSGGEEAAFQEQLKRQFRENLARDPAAMEAYNKATGNETPWYSPSSLRAMENERQAAARRANQMASGAQAIRETAIAQGRNVAVSPEGQIQISDPDPSKAIGRFAVRPSGLMQSQVEELPGGFKAVYDREGRLVGTNLPNVSPLDATDRAAVNRGEGTVAEGQSLRAAMDKAVRAAQQARPAAAPAEAVAVAPRASPGFADALMQVQAPDFTRAAGVPRRPMEATETVVQEQVTQPVRGPMPASLAGTGFTEQMAQFYAPPAPAPLSDPFASRTTPQLESALRKLMPVQVNRKEAGSEELVGDIPPRGEGKLGFAGRLLTVWPTVTDAEVAALAEAFPDMDWSSRGSSSETFRRIQDNLNRIAAEGRIYATSEQPVTSRVGPTSVQRSMFDYRLQTPEERVRQTFATR